MVYSEGNALSILVFFLWVPIALWGAYRWPSAKAASLLLLLPVMFLPEGVTFDLSGLPHFGKNQVAVFWLLIGVLLFHRHRLGRVQLSNWYKASILLLLGGHVVTILLNTQPISDGSVHLHGHAPLEAFSVVLGQTLRYVLPFVLGVAMFRDPKELRVFFRLLVGATLVYGVLQLIEVRLSPQLNTWVYGFFQHSFLQVKRGGGFRPIVFMSHPLVVAMFTMVGLTAAARLYKADITVIRLRPVLILSFLWLVAFLNKSMAALVYALVAVPLVLFAKPKTQFRVAMVLAICVLLYPALRGANLVPIDSMLDLSGSAFGGERAASLTMRFVHEGMLLERALQRPLFGWGGYGRALIYHPWSGDLLSVADGDWIITLGTSGLAGFLGKYLLLLLPVFTAARKMKYVPRQSDRKFLAALALIVAFYGVDLIPNSASHCLPFLFSGVLVGCSTGIATMNQRRKRSRYLDPTASHAGPPPRRQARSVPRVVSDQRRSVEAQRTS